jgi:hypothetical protein
MSKPKPDDDSPKTYFEWERRKSANEGDASVIPQYPQLPKGNPWAADLCGDEPLIDRREDADHFIPETRTED